MANNELLDILLLGAAYWNKWRANHHSAVLKLYDADLTGANLTFVNLSGADLSRADFNSANLTVARLSGANLTVANLGRADLSRADLSGANLTGADLTDANLSGAGLSRANLSGATLSGSDLSGADLTGADLSGAYLIDANLTGANLSRAEFNSANLELANFTGTIFDSTALANVDLGTAKGLNSARHYGPSSIGIDTLYKSGGNIPEVFLRGCGVPDEFITFIPAILGAPQSIQFYSCFISYSTKDEEFSKRLYSRMRDEKLRVWFAPEDIKGGEKIHEQIERAIQIHDRLLIVLSENSLRSEWVMTEIRKARKAERKENRRKLFPIRLVDFETIQEWECFDADSGKDLGVEVREYFIPDFSNWKDHDAFEIGFKRLLRDLRAEESK